ALPARAEMERHLTALAALPERRLALVQLLALSLEAAAAQNGLRLRRAETAREFLRRLPPRWSGLEPLKALAMTEELVQFGGRPVEDTAFETALNQARSILIPGSMR
ncbi:MAG: DUF4129 domain-containing protein, partial [Pseudomonadota bacterium]